MNVYNRYYVKFFTAKQMWVYKTPKDCIDYIDIIWFKI